MTKKKKQIKKWTLLKFVLILILVSTGYYNQELITETINPTKISDKITLFNFNSSTQIQYGLEETNADLKVYFCQTEDCLTPVYNKLSNAKSQIKCAMYDFDLTNLSQTLVQKTKQGVKVQLIIDNDYSDEPALKEFQNTNVDLFSDINRNTKYNNYMHHKFCVIDGETLITGSANPTERGYSGNDNNIIILKSKYLSKNYENEFDQLRSGVFGYNKINTLEYNDITLISNEEEYQISSYMCPQNSCDVEISKYLDNAKEEIVFANFALTHDGIKNKLINTNSRGIEIKGVIEKRNYNLQGSDIKELNNYFTIKNDTNTKTMHHKFWVIDNEYVITGSVNPSFSGFNYNDENLLIIRNRDLASKYKEEFNRLYN